jgi:hypothetical protein
MPDDDIFTGKDCANADAQKRLIATIARRMVDFMSPSYQIENNKAIKRMKTYWSTAWRMLLICLTLGIPTEFIQSVVLRTFVFDAVLRIKIAPTVSGLIFCVLFLLIRSRRLERLNLAVWTTGSVNLNYVRIYLTYSVLWLILGITNLCLLPLLTDEQWVNTKLFWFPLSGIFLFPLVTTLAKNIRN